VRGSGASLVMGGFAQMTTWRVCPYCSKVLSDTEWGVKSHLRKHVRTGELKREDVIDVTNRVCGLSKQKMKLKL
jgi:hypothetical protein